MPIKVMGTIIYKNNIQPEAVVAEEVVEEAAAVMAVSLLIAKVIVMLTMYHQYIRHIIDIHRVKNHHRLLIVIIPNKIVHAEHNVVLRTMKNAIIQVSQKCFSMLCRSL